MRASVSPSELANCWRRASPCNTVADCAMSSDARPKGFAVTTISSSVSCWCADETGVVGVDCAMLTDGNRYADSATATLYRLETNIV